MFLQDQMIINTVAENTLRCGKLCFKKFDKMFLQEDEENCNKICFEKTLNIVDRMNWEISHIVWNN